MDNIIDIETSKLAFNDKEVFIIVDNNNNYWFKGRDICIIVEIKDSKEAFKSYIPDKNKEYFNKLKGGYNQPPSKYTSTVYYYE